MGRQLPEENLLEVERQPLCESCQQQKFGEAVEQDMLEFIEHRYGLTAENKETLQALLYIIDNHEKVLMVRRAMDRTDELEHKLEVSADSLRDLVETKLDNANSRLFSSSLVANFAWFLCGVLASALVSVVIVLISGG